MPGTERIENLISPEALKQFDQLKASADANVSSFEKLVAKAIELNKQLGNTTSFKELNKISKEIEETDQDLINANDRLKKSNKDLGDSFANIAKELSVKFSGSTEDAFEKLVKLNEALKTVKKAQQELQSQKDTFSSMKKDLPEVQKGLDELLKKEADLKKEELTLRQSVTDTNKEIKNRLNLQLSTPGSRDQIKDQISNLKEIRDTKIDINTEEGKTSIAELNSEIDRLNKILEQTGDKLEKRKINIGNYSGAVRTLEKALQDVNKKLDDNTKSGNQNAAVIETLQKEQGLLQSLVDAQSKGFANATGEIRNNQQAILLLSQVYGEDSAVVRELTSQTAKLSDTVSDMKATIKAQASDTHVFDGLIGAAQGLVGVYSIAQGAAAIFGDENEELQKTFVKLQAVMSILQGLQAIQNALQKESAARQLISIGLQKINVLQTNLQTAAESKNIVVRYAAIVAQKALNAVMSLAGGPLLAIIGLLALVIISLSSFSSASQKTARDFAKLNEEFKGFEALLNDEVDAIKRAGEENIAALESQFASEKTIRAARRKALQDESAAIRRFLADNGAAYKEAFNDFETLTNRQRAGESLSDAEKKRLEEVATFVDQFQSARKRDLVIDSQLELDRLNNIKATTEEEIKARQDGFEVLKTQIETRLQLEQSIAGNERKTQTDRINALKEAQRLQEQIINSDTQSKLLTPGLTPSQIKVIEAQRTAALTQARRESNKAIEDLNRSYAERERKARFDIIRSELEDQVKADDLIVAIETNGFDKRLNALYDSFQKRRLIVIAQHDLDIKNDTLTADERIAIEKKYTSDINQLTVEFGLNQQELYKQNHEAVNAIIEKNQQGRLDRISTQQANELTELDRQLQAGNISIETYNRERVNIEQKYAIQSLKQEVDNATARVLATKEGTNERYAAEKELAEKTLALNDEVTSKIKAAQQELTDKKKELTSEAVNTINSLVGFQYDNESAAIQQQLDELDKRKEKEIEVANATITNAQDRANAITKIEAKAQQQKENLERRQRQIDLDRARFEKAANIAQIIATTAAAIIEALKTYKGTPQAFAVAATIGTIGALQLARAIAAPLPKFEHGTDDAPGGLALVSEKRPELVITPKGELIQTPSVPTVMNIPRHSIVLPDARAAMESGLAVNRHGRLVQNENSTLKIEQKLDHIAKVIKNKSVLNMNADQGGLTAIWKYGANWVTYIEDQTKF